MATAPTAARSLADAAALVVRRCRTLATFTTEPGWTTRTFLSEPMHQVHAEIGRWMIAAGMSVSIDAAGNLRGVHAGSTAASPRLYIGSHLDTVPHAGAFDGILGVVAGVALVEQLAGRRLPFAIEVVGFSDEEGVRFGVPFIGRRAFTGTLGEDVLGRRDAQNVTVAEALRAFGPECASIETARATGNALGWIELHIEQGPVLERLGIALGIVDGVAGQTRLDLTFSGAANHAGATPMRDRRDALAGAAEWIVAVEAYARDVAGLVATVGRLDVDPGATNVIAGACRASLDVRHRDDVVRSTARDELVGLARTIAARRQLEIDCAIRLDQPAVPMDDALTSRLASAAARAGHASPRLTSAAGHDTMIVAPRMPAAMLFVRSPGGISHHPDEAVIESDVAAALATLGALVDLLAESSANGAQRG